MLILSATDQVSGQLRIELLVFGRNSRNNFPDKPKLIPFVVDCEIRLVSEAFDILAKNAHTERMECANGEPLCLGSLHHGSHSLSHFVGCFVGKGHREYGIGTDSLVKQIGDSHRDHPGLAGAGAGQNENRPLRGRYCLQLLRVKIEETGHRKSRPQLTARARASNADAHQIFR
jgi:hypothetical protein